MNAEEKSTLRRRLRMILIIVVSAYVIVCGVILTLMYQPPPVVARVLKPIPDAAWMILPMKAMWKWANRGALALGDPAPDFDLPTIDGGQRVRLSALRGQPVVLFFGSYTCRPFRRRMPDMNKLYAPYQGRAYFYFIYIEEAHATDGWADPDNVKDGAAFPNARSLQDRVKAGGACAKGLKIPFPMLADDMDNQVGRTYKAWPIRVYIIDKDGRVAFKSAAGPFGFAVSEIQPALERLLGPTSPAHAAQS